MSLTDERKNYDELTNLATKESASWKHSSFFVIIQWHWPRLGLSGGITSLKIVYRIIQKIR